ncbi:hypothetical protein BKA63DRAFT_593599 [Paraphoma chrysanthemicola]|nr:hypothetical protein BKA63DRAFT_593599 [Paraphoma chrysanthemicola]
MPGGAVLTQVPTDVDRIEAPVTLKAYLMCAFAAFGGIFFGYDSGYINGVMGMAYVKHEFTGLPYPGPNASPAEVASFHIPTWRQSLIVSILSAGTFIGALVAGDLADMFGLAATAYDLLVAGRLVAGLGVGFVSAIIIIYMSEIAPKKVRGMIVSGFQFCITVGILLASVVVYATQDLRNSGSYRIPIAIQWVWALILALGLAFLPESPRYFVKRGDHDKATKSLARLRGQPENSEFIQQELAEIIANHEYEMDAIGRETGYVRGWLNCFKGSIRDPGSNLRRTLLGTSAQMMQQWTGINFIFYFGTVFFQNLGSIRDPFLISLITTLVNVFSTPISFWTVERFGRRPLLIWGAVGMIICQFIISIAGTIDGDNPATVRAEIAFICIYIFFFASTWGPGAWVVVGEMFPLPIRSRGVAMSVASNWFWNCIIAVITPYMVNKEQGNLGAKVFFVWGSLCCCCLLWAYFLVYETKGLSLEQIDLMLQQTTPRQSSTWKPTTTFASGMAAKHEDGGEQLEVIEKA